MIPSQVRTLKPRRMKSTKHPTSVLAMPDTLALKMRALARMQTHSARYQFRRRPKSTSRPIANTSAKAKATAAMFGWLLRPTAREPSRLATWLYPNEWNSVCRNATNADTAEPRTKQIMAICTRRVVSSSWRSIQASRKNTKMALITTSSEAEVETAWDEATTPARMKTKAPKYHAGAAGARSAG